MIHILGAGVAGLMLAEALDRRGESWCIYEKEAAAGLYASGKNAGIIRTYETDPVMRHFAGASLAYYRHEEPSFNGRGLLLRPWDVDYNEPSPETRQFSHGRFAGLFLPENGTIEPGDLMRRLTRRNFAKGEIRYGVDAVPKVDGRRVVGMQLGTGTQIRLADADRLVCACGEGSIALAALFNRPLGLIAHRRTLYEFRNEAHYDGAVEWDEETGVYYRPLGDRLLATAGEQIPVAGETESEDTGVNAQSPVDAKMLAVLGRENPRLSSRLLVSTRTCKRLMPLDNRPYAGPDGRFENLFWFTGLGGRGVSTAPALAAALAGLLCGEPAGRELAALSAGRVDG